MSQDEGNRPRPGRRSSVDDSLRDGTNNLLQIQLAQLLTAPDNINNRTAGAPASATEAAVLTAILQAQRPSFASESTTLPATTTSTTTTTAAMNRESSKQAQALLKHHEDRLRATRLLLQQQEQDGNMQRDPIILASTAMAAAKAAQTSVLGELAGFTDAVRRESGAVSSLLHVGGSNQLGEEDLQAAAAGEDVKEENRSAGDSEDEKDNDMDMDEGYDDQMSDNEYFENFTSTDDNRVIQETFPLKLYRMLHEVEKIGKQNIVSFLPHGKSFVVHKPKAFVEDIMPKYFTTCRLASFQRQLNLYGFRRITEGREKGAYTHDCFVRGKRAMCRKVKRQKTRGKVTQAFGSMQPLANNADQSAVQGLVQSANLQGLLSSPATSLTTLQANLGLGGAASALLGRLSGDSLASIRPTGSVGDVGCSILQEALRRGLLSDIHNARQQNDVVSNLLATHQLQNQLQQQEAERLILQRLRQQQDPN